MSISLQKLESCVEAIKRKCRSSVVIFKFCKRSSFKSIYNIMWCCRKWLFAETFRKTTRKCLGTDNFDKLKNFDKIGS